MIRACPKHGYFEGEPEAKGDACRDCGRETRAVLTDERRVRLSKFVSGALRHFPEDAGLSLDDRGWSEYDDVVDAVVSRYGWAHPEHLDAVVETDPKGRFERCDGRIRAAYGHSVEVELENELDGGSEGCDAEGDVPETLYHGTARRNAESILCEGIVPKGRQEVHLSETVEEARDVGARHGDPVVFEVETQNVEATRRGEGVYAVEDVPPEALSVVQSRTDT